MARVFIVADNILSPLGLTTAQNFEQLKKGATSIKQHQDTALADEPFYASLFKQMDFDNNSRYTRFEQLLMASVTDALKNCPVDPADDKTLFIVSSTKGNITLLETEANTPALQNRIAMSTSAKLVAAQFGFVNKPLVISNACISGIMAIITGMRLIQAGQYQHVVIAGADVISKFILSGFQSFQAISALPCKPFDVDRDGITLGEGAATVILSARQNKTDDAEVLGGSVSNDANHISAPSRTGHELASAIAKALQQAKIGADEIDFISAHGTATIYNDEMEAKALSLAGLQNVPVNSLKGHYGHTLGAAGLIETVVCLQSLKQGLLIPTLGFNQTGTTQALNVYTKIKKGDFKNCLKTASGFGGCNAALIVGKSSVV